MKRLRPSLTASVLLVVAWTGPPASSASAEAPAGEPGVELVLEANEQYWHKTPSVKTLIMRSVPDESTRLAMLKRGEADIAYVFKGPLVEEIQRTPGLTLTPFYPPLSVWFVFPEQWDPKSPWANRRVRLAANLAIDQLGLASPSRPSG